MDRDEFHRRVAGYLGRGTFDDLNARQAAAELYRRFPMPSGSQVLFRRLGVPSALLKELKALQPTPGAVRKELVGIFAKRDQSSTEELTNDLAECLWAAYHQDEIATEQAMKHAKPLYRSR